MKKNFFAITMSSLIKYIQKGDLSSLYKYLTAISIEEARKIINTSDIHGDTLVHFAARFHKRDILSFLIEDMGGNAMAVNKHGNFIIQLNFFYGLLLLFLYFFYHGNFKI
jgi:hypothetical protein